MTIKPKTYEIYFKGQRLSDLSPQQIQYIQDRVIQIPAKDYPNLSLGLYNHFALGECSHVAGKRYTFGRVMHSSTEELTMLGLGNVFVGRCNWVVNGLLLGEPKTYQKWIRDTLGTISSVEQLIKYLGESHGNVLDTSENGLKQTEISVAQYRLTNFAHADLLS